MVPQDADMEAEALKIRVPCFGVLGGSWSPPPLARGLDPPGVVFPSAHLTNTLASNDALNLRLCEKNVF